MSLVVGVWSTVAIFGHFAVFIAIINQLHATRLKRSHMHALEKLAFLAMVCIPASLLIWPDFLYRWVSGPVDAMQAYPAAALYIAIAAARSAYVVGAWIWRKMAGRPNQFLSSQSRVIRVVRQSEESPCGDASTRFLSRIPGNQIFDLDVNEKQLLLARLPPRLDGFSIAHLSDLHLTGHLTEAFFDRVVEHTNHMQADVVAVTGDLVDKTHCMEWLSSCFGRLEAEFGVYAILGNHDKRVGDKAGILRRLDAAGIHYLGGAARHIEVRGHEVVLAGNEQPWFEPIPDMSAADSMPDAIRILLSHTPDQIAWARENRFDLMLAGHTHGGQIRVPVVGPILAHSVYGVKYASGVFYEAPTLLHVSRGVSGVQNIRLNCRPEISKLVLRAEAAKAIL